MDKKDSTQITLIPAAAPVPVENRNGDCREVIIPPGWGSVVFPDARGDQYETPRFSDLHPFAKYIGKVAPPKSINTVEFDQLLGGGAVMARIDLANAAPLAVVTNPLPQYSPKARSFSGNRAEFRAWLDAHESMFPVPKGGVNSELRALDILCSSVKITGEKTEHVIKATGAVTSVESKYTGGSVNVDIPRKITIRTPVFYGEIVTDLCMSVSVTLAPGDRDIMVAVSPIIGLREIGAWRTQILEFIGAALPPGEATFIL